MGTPKQLSVSAIDLLMIRAHLIGGFPNLRKEFFEPVSEDSDEYNCIAWAADVIDDRWWPHSNPADSYWPITWRSVERDCFIEAFRVAGKYEPCGSDFDFDPNYEKVALYEKPNGEPTHMARQLESGRWASKVGVFGWDIIHETVHGVEGHTYGRAALALRRNRNEHEPSPI
jgi:hypothetical protein